MSWYSPSTALENFLLNIGSRRQALSDCILELYTGAPPTNGDAAPQGTKLCTLTAGGGVPTPEVCAQGSITFSGSSGSCTGITVGGAVSTSGQSGVQLLQGTVPYATSLAATVTAIISAINSWVTHHGYLASQGSANQIILTKVRGNKTGPITYAIAATYGAGLATASTEAMGTHRPGVLPVNGLNWAGVYGNVMLINSNWQGTGLPAAGSGTTAGWARFKAGTMLGNPGAGVMDDDSADGSNQNYIRLDLDIASDGSGSLQMASPIIVSGVAVTPDFVNSTYTELG